MAALWSLEAQFRTWLDIEVLACESWAKLGKIPRGAMDSIRKRANFNLARVIEVERETRHDVAAFVSVVQTEIGDAGKYLHLGMTSSDVVDTALCYRIKKSAELILVELDRCLEITRSHALKYKTVPMVGRTHGIHAEPITFGMKWLLFYDLLKRSRSRIESAKKEVGVGKISGALGNYAHIPPEVEKYVCEKLGLQVDSFSTQVISRDRIASYLSSLALLGSAIDTIALELRHLQRTEVAEVREGFTKGQKGSSAMPHKRNPITAENLNGLARLLRGMLVPALENCALWHERDISHSSVERVIVPDANILADFMLDRLAQLLSQLEVFPERMKENLDQLHGVIYSQRVLLALIEKNFSRDEAYEIVQENALRALDEKRPFRSLLEKDSRVTKILSQEALGMLLNPSHYFQNLDYLYKKVLDNES